MTVSLYTRPGCGSCEKVKTQLKFHNISYTEHSVDEVGIDFIKERFPGKNMLPIIVVNDQAYSGPIEIGHVINEFKENLGKELLVEDNEAVNG